MNVAFFIPGISNKGGVERATVSLLNALSDNFENEVNLHLIVFKDNSIFELNENIKVHSLGVENYKKEYLQVILKLRSLIRTHNLDILVSIETMSLLFTILPIKTLTKRPKLVVWEHFNFRNDNNRKLRRWLRWVAAKKSDLVITLTQRDAETWKKSLKMNSDITYIFNINPFNNEKALYRLDSKTAIAVGRYVPIKGFDRLIDAWSLFERKYGNDDWQLKIVGYGELAESLSNKIESLGTHSIQLVSDQNNLQDIYRNAGLYCMTSYSEGLGMVLIEAQSYGIPSIAFDIYAGPKEILQYGSGLLVKDNQLNEYADAIYQLTSNASLRSKMSTSAFKNKKRFDSKVIAQHWVEQFYKLIE